MSDDISLKRLTRSAQEMYRAAWLCWREAESVATRVQMQKAMDAVQPWCARSGRPDAEWKRFAATLPGYLAYWDQMVNAVSKQVMEKIEKDRDKPPPDDLPPAG